MTRVRIAVLLATAALAIAACGGDDADVTSTTTMRLR